jgi:hypothetical protein
MMGDGADHRNDCRLASRQYEGKAKARLSLRTPTEESDKLDSRKWSQGVSGPPMEGLNAHPALELFSLSPSY